MKKHFIFLSLVFLSISFILSCASYEYPDQYGFTGRSSFMAHSDDVISIDISGDGSMLVSSGMDGTVKIWDTYDYSEIASLDEHPAVVNEVAFNPDGSTVVTAGRDGAIRIFDVPEGTLRHTMRGHSEEAFTATFSPDGTKVLSGGRDGTVRLWDVSEGKLLEVLLGHSRTVNTVIFNRDGSKAYSASLDGTLRSWYMEDTIAPGFIEKINSFGLLNISLNPKSEDIACTGIDKIYDDEEDQWNKIFPIYTASVEELGLENMKLREAHSRYAWGLAWAPDGKTLVSSGNDGQVYFWNRENRYDRQRVAPRAGSIWDVVYSPDGDRVYLAAGDGNIIIFAK